MASSKQPCTSVVETFYLERGENHQEDAPLYFIQFTPGDDKLFVPTYCTRWSQRLVCDLSLWGQNKTVLVLHRHFPIAVTATG